MSTRILKGWDPQEDTSEISYDLTLEEDQVTVDFADGRKVWIELEKGTVRVHCFDAEHDEPFNVDIHHNRIEGYHNA